MTLDDFSDTSPLSLSMRHRRRQNCAVFSKMKVKTLVKQTDSGKGLKNMIDVQEDKSL